MLRLRNRITNVLGHFGLEPPPLRAFKPLIEAAQAVGRLLLQRGQTLEVKFRVPPGSEEGSIMVIPQVTFSWEEEETGVIDFGMVDSPSAEGTSLGNKY